MARSGCDRRRKADPRATGYSARGGGLAVVGEHLPALRLRSLGSALAETARARKNRKGQYFINFSPAVSDKAVKAIRAEIRSWNLHLRSDKSIEDLSRMFNPIIRGWLQYYGRFYRSALYPPMRQLDRSLARWADRKYKKLRRHLRRATHWVARISRRDPKLWAHWQMGVRRGSMAGAV
jgi:Group II intron, maturase-specific domain